MTAGMGAETMLATGAYMPERFTLITYMFIHGNWIHLLGNMLFLWVFGDNVEDAMGHIRFIMFYLMCGIFAALLHSWMLPDSDLPLIGASGAVAGIIAAYLILHPKVKSGCWHFGGFPSRSMPPGRLAFGSRRKWPISLSIPGKT